MCPQSLQIRDSTHNSLGYVVSTKRALRFSCWAGQSVTFTNATGVPLLEENSSSQILSLPYITSVRASFMIWHLCYWLWKHWVTWDLTFSPISMSKTMPWGLQIQIHMGCSSVWTQSLYEGNESAQQWLSSPGKIGEAQVTGIDFLVSIYSF